MMVQVGLSMGDLELSCHLQSINNKLAYSPSKTKNCFEEKMASLRQKIGPPVGATTLIKMGLLAKLSKTTLKMSLF
jgi:hypothetical protein